MPPAVTGVVVWGVGCRRGKAGQKLQQVESLIITGCTEFRQTLEVESRDVTPR